MRGRERGVVPKGDHRGASTLAAPRSRVLIDGKSLPIPTRADSKVEAIRGRLVDGQIELIEVRAQHPDDNRHFVALTLSGAAFELPSMAAKRS